MENNPANTLKVYYLKERSKFWFWPLMAFAIISIAFGTYMNIYQVRFLSEGLENVNPMSVFLTAGLQSFVICAGWAFFYLIYGFRNEIKVYKTLFIIRAALQLPWMICRFLSAVTVSRLLFSQSGLETVHTVTSIVYLAATLYDIVFFAVIAFGKSANALLRAASLIGAVLSLLDIAKTYIMIFKTADIIEKFGSSGYVSMLGFSSSLLLIFGLVTAGLFFGSMSFSARPVFAEQNAAEIA